MGGREKGKPAAGKKEKGKRRTCNSDLDLTRQRTARTHAQHETKRFPGWVPPPTSDILLDSSNVFTSEESKFTPISTSKNLKTSNLLKTPILADASDRELADRNTGGKPSTWFPPGRRVGQDRDALSKVYTM